MRNTASITILLVLLALALRVVGAPDDEKEKKKKAAPAAPTYVGVARCRKCHNGPYRGWKKKGHADAWTTLPAKFHKQKDKKGRECISCHVTGYGMPGGFVDPVKSKGLLGVQCEACHGPGSLHVEAGERILRDDTRKEKNKFPPGQKTFILRKPESCITCHDGHTDYSKFAPKKKK